MLNQEQIAIANFLLKYLKDCGGKSSLDDYPHKLEKKGFDYFESSFTIDFLIAHTGLLDNWKTDRWIRLTTEGYKAADIGFEKYFEQVEKEKKLEIDSLSATIEGVETAKRTAKTSKIISITAIVAAIVIPISIEVFKNVVNKPSDDKTNSQNGIENSNPAILLNLSDTLLIKKLKYSLKHDTVFLDGIKGLINRNE
jgi:hypothetical protein